MSFSAEKLAPRIIALAAVGYCVWPSLAALVSGPETKPAAAGKSEQVAAKTPAKPPTATRDPFLDHIALAAEAEEQTAQEAKSAGKNKGKMTAGQSAEKALSGAADPLAGLSLEATCIMGNQRLAVINGRLYGPKDVLAAGVSGGTNRRVVDVQPHKVVLDCNGTLRELHYANAPVPRNQDKKTAVKAKTDEAEKSAEETGPAAKKIINAKTPAAEPASLP
jgi:hypothetical protein